MERMEKDAIVLQYEGFHEGHYEPDDLASYAYEGDYHALLQDGDVGFFDTGAGDDDPDWTPSAEWADDIDDQGTPQTARPRLKDVDDVEQGMVAMREIKKRPDQAALMPLALDISGETESPVPISVSGSQCACCGLQTKKLWQGARTALDEPHAVCTLCYLTGHLDSPTAAHGQLAYLPGLAPENAIHLQRRALLAILGGTEEQQAEGNRIWSWMDRHAREVEVNWGTARAGEFAHALKRLSPGKRSQLQQRLAGCVLMLPADMFSDLSLLLPATRTVESALTSYSWATYTRSDLYVEPVTGSSESENEQTPADLAADRP